MGKQLSAIFLSLLLILTPLCKAYVVGNLIQQPRVFTQTFTKSIEVEGKKLNFQGFGKVTTYVNGTKQFELSLTVENISTIVPKIRVNITKTIQPETESLTIRSSSGPVQASYEGNLREEPWDDLYFVLAPGNATIWVKYHHNNNYWRYYQYEWNRPWEMSGKEKLHTHMAVSDVEAWISGAKSDEEIMHKYVSGTSLGIRIIGIALAAFLAYAAGGLLGVILGIITGALAQFLAWLLEQLGITNKAEWIRNVIQAEQGDGFFWSWGFHTKYIDAMIVRPLKVDIRSRSDVHELFKWHRVCVLFYEVREFYQSWGAERDTNIQTVSVELWYERWFNPGVFGLPCDFFALPPW